MSKCPHSYTGSFCIMYLISQLIAFSTKMYIFVLIKRSCICNFIVFERMKNYLLFTDEIFQENLRNFKSICEQSNEFIVTSWITKALVTRNHSEGINWLSLASTLFIFFYYSLRILKQCILFQSHH